jgi:hypothetical protein
VAGAGNNKTNEGDGARAMGFTKFEGGNEAKASNLSLNRDAAAQLPLARR